MQHEGGDDGAPTPAAWASRLATVAVATGLLMDLVDSSALATAVPTMARAFGVTPLALKFALTAYLATVAALVPASGWLANRFGAKRVFLVAMSLFLTGSMACALSASLPTLIGARILQGIGGSMMTPVGRSIVVASSPRSDLVRAMGWFTMPAIIGPLLGPPVAGVLIEQANWRWIFFLNAPIAVLGICAVAFAVPRMPGGARTPFDARGFFLISFTIVCLLALTESQGHFGPWQMWAALAGLGAGAYLAHARRCLHPVLALSLFRHGTLSMGLAAGSLVRLAAGAMPLLLPLLLQSAMGMTPLRASIVTVCMAFGALTARFTMPVIARTFGFKRGALGLTAFVGLFSALPALFTATTPLAAIAVCMLAVGIVRGALLVSLTTLTYADTANEEIGQASVLVTVSQQLSFGAGLNVAAWILEQQAGAHALAVQYFPIPFLTMAALSTLALAPLSRLAANAGDELSGRKRAAG
jgi:EmrB/QacA subfamily drug resistance transporter